jgi:hypothetical protein
MRGALLVGLGSITVIALLGCSGIWEEAAQKAVSEHAVEYRGQLLEAEESPERDQLDGLLIDLRDHPENVGIIDIATFEIELTEALSDGTISPDELTALQATLAEIRKP